MPKVPSYGVVSVAYMRIVPPTFAVVLTRAALRNPLKGPQRKVVALVASISEQTVFGVRR